MTKLDQSKMWNNRPPKGIMWVVERSQHPTMSKDKIFVVQDQDKPRNYGDTTGDKIWSSGKSLWKNKK